MKETIFTLLAFIVCININAQTVKLYKGTTLVAEYNADQVDNVEFIETDTQESDSHEYVDLGLPSGTLWATCNVGASKPEECGYYFAWGETTGYIASDNHDFSWTNYKWCSGTNDDGGYYYYDMLTKYCTSSRRGIVDNKTVLDPEDDAATVNWGKNWCMPSVDQLKELNNSSYTTIALTTQKGIEGLLIRSKKNGKTLFLPITGWGPNNHVECGMYWTRSLFTNFNGDAYNLVFSSGGMNFSGDDSRCSGHPIRPVRAQ